MPLSDAPPRVGSAKVSADVDRVECAHDVDAVDGDQGVDRADRSDAPDRADSAGRPDAADRAVIGDLAGGDETTVSAAARVEALLDSLEANGYLSAERFIESRVQARSPRFGNLRIRRELKDHQLVLSAEALLRLQQTELSRACELYARRFDGPPANAAERARRARFLSGRGFSFDVIARVLGRQPDLDEADAG